MKAEEFFALVAKMRDKQREYFETRHKLTLVEAKRLEHAVDNEIYRVKALLRQGAANKKRPCPIPKPTQHSWGHTKAKKRPPFWGSRRMAGRVVMRAVMRTAKRTVWKITWRMTWRMTEERSGGLSERQPGVAMNDEKNKQRRNRQQQRNRQ
nr:MAG TPA: hypothetical protein [Caudoviricetes sp.]